MKKIFFFILSASALISNAQWSDQATGFITSNRGANTITIVNPNTVWVTAIDGTNASNYITEFSRTSNGGNTWIPGAINTGITGAGIANISAISDSVAWACIFHPSQTVAGGIWKTIDGGNSWDQQTTAAFSVASFPNFVHFWDANNGVAAGDPNGGYFEIYTTSDGGATWTRTPNTGNQLTPSALSEYGYTNGFSVAGNALWFCTTKGRIFKTTDKGLTFSVDTVGNGITDVQRISFANADTGYACMHTPGYKSWKIAKTTDGGSSWLPLQNNTTTTNTMIFGADICAVPGTNALVSVGSDASAIGSTYSHDGGLTWHFMEDTTVAPARLSVRFFDDVTGWSGTFNQGQFTGGVSKFAGVVGIPSVNATQYAISLMPNPSEGVITITTSKLRGNAAITVYSGDGKKVYSEQLILDAVMMKQFDLSFLPAGIYIAEVRTADGAATQKFLLR